MAEAAVADAALHELREQTLTVRDLLSRVRRGYPRHVPLENLRDPRFEVSRPLPVVLEEDDGQFVATWYDADVFGYGDTEQEALEDLCDGIVSLWDVLKREAAGEGLVESLAQQWAFLRRTSREV